MAFSSLNRYEEQTTVFLYGLDSTSIDGRRSRYTACKVCALQAAGRGERGRCVMKSCLCSADRIWYEQLDIRLGLQERTMY